MRRVFGVWALVAILTGGGLRAQAPHGGQTAPLQPGPNVNAVGGIADPKDSAALVKADLNLQRQNETSLAASTRNADHILAAANDYRFVDFPQDQYYGGAQNFFTRLIARLFGRPGQRVPPRAAAAVGAWTGIYRSCDRGRTWLGSAVPGSPLDFSDASKSSALKRLSELAEVQGGHAETTDPVLVAGPGGRMHLVVLGFVRFPNGSVGESRMYYVSYTDRNNLEGGSCFTYDFMQEIDRGSAYAAPNSPGPFIDKPSVAVDKDGTLYAAYTVFADTVKSKIVVARSTNGGATWSKTIPLLNLGFLRNHGTTLTIDPLDGTVYVAWRMFYDNWPLMVISKSPDGGRTFLPASPISNAWPGHNLEQIIDHLRGSKLQPFDQFSGEPGDPPIARALAFPSIVAGVVNGRSKLFAAWTERADVDPRSPTWGLPSATGSPRIMISMSSDGGWTWTARRAVDAGTRTENLIQPGLGSMITRPSGPQLQPVLSMSGTTNPQLLVMYYEAREELDAPHGANFVSGIERMLDVRTARIDPVTGTLLAPSMQVSQYPVMANSSPAALPEIVPGYRMANRQNLTMYAGGTTAFIGDYPGLAPSRTFEFKSGRWTWPTDPGPSLAMWTDNRDVAFPLNAEGKADINGAWTNYQPLVPTDPFTAAAPDCSFVASRNSNPYFSEIGGVIAGAPQSFKPLTIQRAFATYVENRTPQDRFFRLTIEDNEIQGIDGSFDQFDFGAGGDVRNVAIFGNSSHHRTIWVQPRPQGPTASLSMLVQETVALGGALKADGYRARVVLNPDPNNDALTDVPPLAAQYAGDPTITADSSELHNPQISSPQISTFRVSSPQISSPQISSPQISTPQVSSPQISSPQISSPQISSPQISTPQISTAPPDEQNGTDVTYTVRNLGTTWTTYDAMFNVPNAIELIGSGNYQFQVLVTRTSLVPAFVQSANGCSAAARQEVHVLANIPVPQISSPQISTISNPQISSPQISSPQIATFSLAPSGGATVSQPGGADPDSHSAMIPDQVQVTVRAIALKPRAEILASGGTLFEPATVQAKVTSSSTNVVQGTVEAPGTQPTVVTRPDLIVATTSPVPPRLNVPAGGGVSLAPVTIRNEGSEPESGAGTSVGYYLSADPVITAQDTLLASDSVPPLAIGGEFTLEGRNLTIPATTTAGTYYIGVLADRLDAVIESDEGNNYISVPITVTAAQPLTFVTQPSDATARQPIVPAVQVAARDATGAGLPGVSVTLSLAANPTGATLTGTTAATNALGIATFPALAVSQAGSGYTLQASAASQSSAPSFPFNVTGAGALVCGEAAFNTSQLGAHRVQPDPQFVAVADFNRDGRRDVVTANVGSNDVSVLLADASRGFGEPATYAIGASPAGLAIGDINRDGHPDIVVARANAPTVVVLAGNALGGFGAAASYAVGNIAGVLTTADVNEDGRLDIVVAATDAADGSGRLVILPGSGADGFGAPTATPAGGPTSLPAAVSTADLNGDGHLDVVISNHGEDNVGVFLGDGAGGFAPRVTYADGGGALVVGDFTSDGHPDVAVVQSHGTTITFLRGSASGTLTPGTPLTLAAEGRALVATDIDGDGQLDLAAAQAEGFSTFLGNGDGGFSPERTQDPNSEARALAVGDFNSDAKPDFVVANGAPADAVTFLTNSCVAGPRQLLVSNTNNDGAGSLRAAMLNAEMNSGFKDSVVFKIPGSGVHTIAPQTGLPPVSEPIIIDGTTQPGYAGSPLIELDGTNTRFSMGFLVRGGNSIFRALVINRFSEGGIAIEDGGGNRIEGMFIGTDPTGTLALPNSNFGIAIVNAATNTIGGSAADSRNLISGNAGAGIQVSGTAATNNIIAGNLIGTDISGTVAIGNLHNGVMVAAGAANIIGGTTAGARNVISGNTLSGIQIDPGADGTVVQGNFIGTDITGSRALGNGTQGVRSDGSDNLVIGGTAAGAGNLISGNQNGVLILGAGDVTAGNRIEGNFIGTNASGTVAIGNRFDGVIIGDGINNHVGGTTAAHTNVISGNTRVGVLIQGALSTGNRVEGNVIGLGANCCNSTTVSVPNQIGVYLADTGGNVVGVDTEGAGRGNVVSGNTDTGILLWTANNNVIAGNAVGTNAGGDLTFANGGFGIDIQIGNNNLLGGNLKNVIKYNVRDGVRIMSGAGNRIVNNNISVNGRLGIDLEGFGSTANDPSDADTGPNDLQNYPVLTSVEASGSTRVRGSLNSTPNAAFTVEVFANATCDESGFGEGERSLGTVSVTTDEIGMATFDVSLGAPVTAGELITATATKQATGSTSEFSPCQQVSAPATFTAFTPPGTAAETTTTNPRSGNGSLELVSERRSPASINEPAGIFGTFGQLSALSFDWAIDPDSQGLLPPDLALRVYPANDPRSFFLHWDRCSPLVVCVPRQTGQWTTTNLIGQLSIEAAGGNTPPVSLAEIPADAPITGIHIRGNYSFGLPSFAFVDNVTIGFTGAPPTVFNFELEDPAASRHRPSIAWSRPAAIAAGTPLSVRELNAVATTPGTFVYAPAAGELLTPDVHELFVRFTATDATSFLPVSTLVPVTVTGLATVLPEARSWFPYLPTPGALAEITTTNPRSGTASLELSKVSGDGSALIHEFHTINFGTVSELSALSMDWFIDPISEGARPPQLALRVYEYGDPRSFFLYWDTCSEVTPCDPHSTGSWQSTDLIGRLRIQGADGNPPPAEVPPDAPITGIHIRADFGFGGFWHGFADNVAIGFGGREPIVFNFER